MTLDCLRLLVKIRKLAMDSIAIGRVFGAEMTSARLIVIEFQPGCSRVLLWKRSLYK